MAEKSYAYYLWEQYRADPDPEYRKGVLETLDLDTNLQLVAWRGQIELLDGAPDDIVLKYLPKLYFKAQVQVYDNLPAYLLEGCKSLLKPEAMKKLGLAVRNKKFDKKFNSIFDALM